MSEAILFYAVAGIVVASSCVVAFSQNIIRSAFALLVSFFGVGLLYWILSADFMAVAQLLLYVGGIMVLILFAVMLTNRIGEIHRSNPSSRRGLGALVAIGMFATLAGLAFCFPWPATTPEGTYASTVREVGNALLGPFLLPFEVASVVLLVSLIGAVNVVRLEARPREEGE